MDRILCSLIGYLFGSFLTADVVAYIRTGKSACELGSGNPGTANMTQQFGAACGALVLLGDILKTVLACVICRILFTGIPDMSLVALYAGLGAVIGHNFPVWKRFKGGKGVAVTCTAIVLAAPFWGLVSCIAGLAAVLITGYLPLGAVFIPLFFALPAFFCFGLEAGLLSVALLLLMLSRHHRGLNRIFQGKEKRFRPQHRKV